MLEQGGDSHTGMLGRSEDTRARSRMRSGMLTRGLTALCGGERVLLRQVSLGGRSLVRGVIIMVVQSLRLSAGLVGVSKAQVVGGTTIHGLGTVIVEAGVIHRARHTIERVLLPDSE